MGAGGWKEERYLPAPADIVFESIVSHLADIGYDTSGSNYELRGVVANQKTGWSAFPARIAAAVDSAGEASSRVIVESMDAYAPNLAGESLHRGDIDRLFASIEDALARRRGYDNDINPEGP